VVRSPAEWLDRLPEPDTLLADAPEGRPTRSARVAIRRVIEDRPVCGEAGYLNRVEVFGEETEGTLALFPDRLRVSGAGRGDEYWPLETLTAVQASSGALQLKRRDQPLVAFRFLDDAVYLWERLVRAALRDFYGRTGRGTIREFQPRIDTG
jgi:hypothetical protein